MPMSWKSTALRGGLDLVTPPFAMRAGRLIGDVEANELSYNYEPCPEGYRRIKGYERFDGRARPSDTTDTATKAARRAAITAVPGAGPVRGIVMYADYHSAGATRIYAFRNNVGHTASVPHVATSSGWSAIDLGYTLRFKDGGPTEPATGETVTGATSGATGIIRSIEAISGDWAAGTAEGIMTITDVVGTFTFTEILNFTAGSPASATSGDSLSFFKANSRSATTSLAAAVEQGHYDFDVYNFSGDRFGEAVFGADGWSAPFRLEWVSNRDVYTALVMPTNGSGTTQAMHIACHAEHLFLSMPGGSIVVSGLGEPFNYTATAGATEIAFGNAVRGFIADYKGALAIIGESKTAVLYGKDVDTFDLDVLSDDAGGIAWTMQLAGKALYYDSAGLRDLGSTEDYGNFSIGTLTRLVQPLIDKKREDGVKPTASMRVKSKDQYRLFFDDGSGLIVYFGTKDPEIIPFELPIVVTCAWSGHDYNGDERLLVGAEDGYVYELDRGDSFDGAAIDYRAQTAFDYLGGPNSEKKLAGARLEVSNAEGLTLEVEAATDYAAASGTPESVTVANKKAFADVNAVCESVSLVVTGGDLEDEPHVLTGYAINAGQGRSKRRDT